ncbi:hypothetical protein ACHAW6_013350 [Cyclotella cf. meneghiniana]
MTDTCDELALPILTKSELQSVAQAHGGYSTPSLNDTLYLHCKGYRCIENLEEYTGLKSLWLHSNGFGKIENLGHLSELRCLFLQCNVITRIENLEGLRSLVQLDLSENNITFVEGLSHLTHLTTLNLSRNALENADSISHLKECSELSSLDLSKNYLTGEDIIDCLAGIMKLASLNMAGNPVVSKVAYFRKKMIAASKTLRYLDLPVFDAERAAVEAWQVGGIEAEAKVKEQWHQMNKDKNRQAMEDFRAWRATIRRTESGPRYEVDGPELVHDTDVDNVISFCEERKVAYLSDHTALSADDPPPLFHDKSRIQDQVDAREGTAEVVQLLGDEEKPQPPVAVTSEAPVNEPIPKIVIEPLIEPLVAETIGPNEKVLFDEAGETVKQEETGEQNDEKPGENEQDEDTDLAEFLGGKRVRDSIAILKRSTPSTTKPMIGNLVGWTPQMEETLVRKTKEFGYNFELVAEAMSDEFRDAEIKFDEENCHCRFSLLDLAAPIEIVPDLTVQNEFVFPSTKKPLGNFLNADGSRKTIDDICRNSSCNVIFPLKIPYSEECDEGIDDMDGKPARPFSRSEIWNMLESAEVQGQSQPDETKFSENDEKKEASIADLD